MLNHQPAQSFPRSSLFPSMPSARMSLRYSLSRKRRRAAKQLPPTTPLTPIPEVTSREVTPTLPEATTATSSANTSNLTSGETTRISTAATSPQTEADTAGPSPDDAASPISPLTPAAGLEVAPPSSPAWWLNLPYPSASTTPLPTLNAESTPWRSSYVPVLRAWESYLGRHLGGAIPPSALALHTPATPPPQQEGGDAAPRLRTPPPPASPQPLLRDEDIRWTETGSPQPPAVPAKDAYSLPLLHHSRVPPEPGLELFFPPAHQPSHWPPSSPSPPLLSCSFPPSPTPSEPPSPPTTPTSPLYPLSPFPSPPSSPAPLPSPTPPAHSSLPEVVPEQNGLHLHLHHFPPSPHQPPNQQQEQRRGRAIIRRSSSFPPTIPMESARAREFYAASPVSASPSPPPTRDGEVWVAGGPVPAVRPKKASLWRRVWGAVRRKGGGKGG